MRKQRKDLVHEANLGSARDRSLITVCMIDMYSLISLVSYTMMVCKPSLLFSLWKSEKPIVSLSTLCQLFPLPITKTITMNRDIQHLLGQHNGSKQEFVGNRHPQNPIPPKKTVGIAETIQEYQLNITMSYVNRI